jgi:hypothetical protein
MGKDSHGGKRMYSILMVLGMVGYGVGFEGYEDGKMYVGVYTPNVEYGYVVGNGEIYLDTIFTKKLDN